MHSVGQSWLVLHSPDSPLRLGLIGTLQFAPILLFSIVTGAIADRLPKRRLLVATNRLATLALVLAAWWPRAGCGTGTWAWWPCWPAWPRPSTGRPASR